MSVQIGETVCITSEDDASSEAVVIGYDLAGAPETVPTDALRDYSTFERYVGALTAQRLAQSGLLADALSV